MGELTRPDYEKHEDRSWHLCDGINLWRWKSGQWELDLAGRNKPITELEAVEVLAALAIFRRAVASVAEDDVIDEDDTINGRR